LRDLPARSALHQELHPHSALEGEKSGWCPLQGLSWNLF